MNPTKARISDALLRISQSGRVGIKSISQKIIDLEEQKSQIEQEMMENEATLSEAKQKAASVALWEQKLTAFEVLFNETTPEERKDLLRLHINYLIHTPDGIQLALFDSSNEADRSEVQRVVVSGSGGRTRTYDPVVNSHLLCQLSYAGT